jgi:hypothetical protein
MTADEAERIWSGIDVSKVIAGTLAAVTAAVCASVLGVAGTLIGAGVASLVGTVGQELYAKSLTRGYRRLRDTRTGAPQSASAASHSASAATPGTVSGSASVKDPAAGSRPTSVTGLRSTAARAEAPAGSTHLRTAARTAEVQKVGRPRWQRIALATLAAFVLAMIAVSAVELLGGRSLASMFGNDSAGRTTISSVVDGPKQPEATAPAPAGSSTAPQAPDGTPTTADSAVPSPEATTTSAPGPAPEQTTQPPPAVEQTPPAATQAPVGAVTP